MSVDGGDEEKGEGEKEGRVRSREDRPMARLRAERKQMPCEKALCGRQRDSAKHSSVVLLQVPKFHGSELRRRRQINHHNLNPLKRTGVGEENGKPMRAICWDRWGLRVPKGRCRPIIMDRSADLNTANNWRNGHRETHL